MSDIHVGDFLILSDRKYIETHEWVLLGEKFSLLGVSDYAVKMLKEIAYVELPEVGTEHEAGTPFVFLESLKATGEVYAPMNLKVVGINERLEDEPELLNSSPYAEGYLVKIEHSKDDLEKMLDAKAYASVLEQDI